MSKTQDNDWLDEIVGTFIALKFDVDVDDFSDGTLERWNNMKQAIQSKVDEMVRLARIELRNLYGEPRCQYLHHPKKWQHPALEDCPAENAINQLSTNKSKED